MQIRILGFLTSSLLVVFSTHIGAEDLRFRPLLFSSNTFRGGKEGDIQLRFTLSPLSLPFQEAIIQIMKMRKRITNAQLQTELVEILKNMFLPQKKMIKEQMEWLIEHKYIKRDETDLNTFIYMA